MAPRLVRLTSSMLVAWALAMGILACHRPSGSEPGSSARSASTEAAPGARLAGASAAAGVASAKAVAARVVFIGKKEACDCTRKAIDAGWKALEAGLGTEHAMPIEKLEADTDADKVATYRLMKPHMALPALYFLDVNDGLVEMLQGEITEAQVRAIVQ